MPPSTIEPTPKPSAAPALSGERSAGEPEAVTAAPLSVVAGSRREARDAKDADSGARIVVSNLAKIYRHGGVDLPVLRDVNLILERGDMAAVVGASGVGKSTFLQILGTLDLPTVGSISFNGEELTQMTPSRLAQFRNRQIGFVFQFHHLLPEFTALENVMMPALVQRVPLAQAQRRAADILGRVGLSKRTTHRPSELSGGEQQRVALARAMVLEPSLLLADEPTGNLDRATGEAIHQLFLELNRERGSTLLVVTHNPELADLMPRKLRMGDLGKIIDETAGAKAQAPAAPPAPAGDASTTGGTI